MKRGVRFVVFNSGQPRKKNIAPSCEVHRAKANFMVPLLVTMIMEKLGIEPRTFSTQQVLRGTMLRRCHTTRPYPLISDQISSTKYIMLVQD
jgi:hypothetical protein